LKRYLLGLLMVISVFNALDRVALGIVLEDIKNALHATDTQLGFLTGIAFAFFYSIAGIPIARWADRGNRVSIISITAALWSIAVALCGAAGSFLQLLLIRIGVAVGESGCIPPTHSLLAEYFPRSERARATAIFMLSTPLALSVGYLASGWLNQAFGWRLTFVILALPGLVLALLAWFTLVEPRAVQRSAKANVCNPGSATSQPSVREVCVTLWTNTAFRHLVVCYSVWAFFGWGILQWQPAFFIRSHDVQTGELGTWFAGIYGLAGGLGVYLGGAWASRYAARNERLQLRVCGAAFVFFALLTAAAHIAPNRYAAFGLLALASLGGNVSQGPILGTIQTLVPPRMRAMSIALMYLFSNLIGAGLGPLAVGTLSDRLYPWLGEESLRWALVILCPGYFWAAWHLWRASRTVLQDMRGAQTEEEAKSASEALWRVHEQRPPQFNEV